jgi:hypothetical protein
MNDTCVLKRSQTLPEVSEVHSLKRVFSQLFQPILRVVRASPIRVLPKSDKPNIPINQSEGITENNKHEAL